MKKITHIFFLFSFFIIGCRSITVNNGFKQGEVSKGFISLVHQGKFPDAFNLLDSSNTKVSFDEFEASAKNYSGLTKKYGNELQFINSENSFGANTEMYSNMFFKFKSDTNDKQTPKVLIAFKFKGGTEKIAEINYVFNELNDKIKIPFAVERCNSEKVLYYFEKWVIEKDTVFINSISLLGFSDNMGIIAVKVVYDLPNYLGLDSVKNIGKPIANYALENGYYEKVKNEATKLGVNFTDKIGITFWRPIDEATYSVSIDVKDLK